MSDETPAVIIADGSFSVRLCPITGEGYLGKPTSIEIKAGEISATKECECADYLQFHVNLKKLYDTLTGQARLGSLHGFDLIFSGDGIGGIKIAVELRDGAMMEIRLSFEFEFDQSFLPAIIKSIDEAFL